MSNTTVEEKIHDVVIVGSGPAGYTAAIYTARANLKPVLIAGMLTPGGELMNTTEVENFPGFPDGIMGPELMERMQKQAEKFGTEIIFDDAVKMDLESEIKTIELSFGDIVKAKTVILATGSAYRKLGVEGEEEYTGHGVSWCATCDAAFFENKKVTVIGGGDSAMEEALFLTKFTDEIILINRTDNFRASEIMKERVFQSGKISVLTNHSVAKINGKERTTEAGFTVKEVDSITLVNNQTNNNVNMPTDGLFIAIGQDPRTDLVKGQVDLNPDGTINVTRGTSITSIDGVFACGDVIDPHYRQAITAAASGCIAAQDVEHYLLKKNDNK